MGAKEIIELLILAVSLISPIMFSFLENRGNSNFKKPYKLPTERVYLDSLRAGLSFLLILSLYAMVAFTIAYLAKSNLTYIMMLIIGVITYNVYEKILDKKVNKYPSQFEKIIVEFHNVKCKMVVQSYLISLACVYGIDNIFSITHKGNLIVGWVYFGIFLVTLPAYLNIYLTYFYGPYIHTIYEIRTINNYVYKVNRLYETENALILLSQWGNHNKSRNYLELKKDYISSIAIQTQDINIKNYLKKIKKKKKSGVKSAAKEKDSDDLFVSVVKTERYDIEYQSVISPKIPLEIRGDQDEQSNK